VFKAWNDIQNITQQVPRRSLKAENY